MRNQIPPKLRQAIREYMSNREELTPVSIADLRARVRNAMPEIQETDEVLGEMIAAEVVATGGDVEFDGRIKR